MRRALVPALAAILLILAATAQARGVYITGAVSVYQTRTSVAPGWQADLGAGYAFLSFMAVEGTFGYANYYVDDASRRRQRVDALPLDASVVLFWTLPVVRPFLNLGPSWTWERVEERKNWVGYTGAHAQAGLDISLGGVVSLTPAVGYRAYDWGDWRRGAWYYGLSFGVNVTR